MKILDGMPVSGQPPGGPKAPGKNPASGPSFNEILKDTVDASAKSETRSQVSSVTPSAQMQPTALQPAVESADSPAIDRIERFLDIMEDYRCKLSDPHCSLKQIQPLVDRMTAEKENMLQLLNELPDQEPLKDVLNRALFKASKEEWKFYGGDYV